MIDALMVLVILKEEWNNIQIIHDMDQSISVLHRLVDESGNLLDFLDPIKGLMGSRIKPNQ